MRWGSYSMVVEPKACSIVTGKASASALVPLGAASSPSVEPVAQPVRASAPQGDGERKSAQSLHRVSLRRWALS